MARGAILSVTKRRLEKIPPAPFVKGGARDAALFLPPLSKGEKEMQRFFSPLCQRGRKRCSAFSPPFVKGGERDAALFLPPLAKGEKEMQRFFSPL
jgi:hypothetical protein